MTPSTNSMRPITDSPWYWMYCFATAGLIALIMMGPRFEGRQSQIESQAIRRQQAALMLRGQEVPAEELDEQGRTLQISLRPLYAILAGILAVAWAAFWLQHFRQKHPTLPHAESTSSPSADKVETPVWS